MCVSRLFSKKLNLRKFEVSQYIHSDNFVCATVNFILVGVW